MFDDLARLHNRLFEVLSHLRIRAARGRECVYVLQMFLSVFSSSTTTIVHKYETTVLGNG